MNFSAKQVLPGGPASLGGLAKFDTIVAIDGKSVTVREIQPAIMANDVPGSKIVVTVEGPDGRERDAICYRACSEKMKPVTKCFELIAALQQKVGNALYVILKILVIHEIDTCAYAP